MKGEPIEIPFLAQASKTIAISPRLTIFGQSEWLTSLAAPQIHPSRPLLFEYIFRLMRTSCSPNCFGFRGFSIMQYLNEQYFLANEFQTLSCAKFFHETNGNSSYFLWK